MSAAAVEAPVRMGQKVRAGLARDLKSRLENLESLVVVKTEQVPAQDLNQLRRNLEASDSELTIVKNSLCRVVFKELGWDPLGSLLDGTCGVTSVKGDIVATCRTLAAFAKDHEGLVLQGGFLDGKPLSSQEVQTLSKLPSREVLLSKLVGGIQAPLSGLVSTLNGIYRKLVVVLGQITETKS
jgi:large subunit ribosomal protein L10